MQAGGLVRRQRRGRVPLAAEQAGGVDGSELVHQHQRTQHQRARILALHPPGDARAGAQNGVDSLGDRSPVAGAGEAVRLTPSLQRVVRVAPPRLKRLQNLDGGGEAGGGRHVRG